MERRTIRERRNYGIQEQQAGLELLIVWKRWTGRHGSRATKPTSEGDGVRWRVLAVGLLSDVGSRLKV